MALKKPAPTAASNDTASADTGTDTATMERPAETPQSDPVVTATTAIAKASGSSIGAVNEAAATAKAFKKEVEAMENAADFSYGSHRVFKASSGGDIQETANDKLSLGRWVKVRMLAWGRSYQVSPGEDGASSGDFVAYSTDKITIDGGQGDESKAWIGKPVQEYLEYLRTTEEFDKASLRDFINVQCAVLGSENEPDFRGVIQVTLASSSIAAFKSYQTKLEGLAKCVAMGLPGYEIPADPFTFFFVRELASSGNKKWVKLKIETSLPVKI